MPLNHSNQTISTHEHTCIFYSLRANASKWVIILQISYSLIYRYFYTHTHIYIYIYIYIYICEMCVCVCVCRGVDFQVLWFHTQRKDGANTVRLRPTQRNRRSHYDTIKKHKSKIRSPDGDTNYFDIVVGVLQGATLAQYLFIICLDYVLRTPIDKMKDIGFKLTEERSRRYLGKTISCANYPDDIVLLANTPAQTENLLHNLERAAAGIDLPVNAHKTIYMI